MPIPDLPEQPPRLTRRAALVALAGLGSTAVAGCSSGSSTSLPGLRRATPTPDPTVLAAVRAEQLMGDWLAALPLMGSASVIPAAQRTALAALRDAHHGHSALLAARDEALADASPSPSASVGKVTGTWQTIAAELARREKALAAQHRATALQGKDATAVLLAASLATFATAAASPTLPVTQPKHSPGEVTAPARVDALGALLSQLRALVEGLQVGIGQVDDDALDATGTQRLTAVLATRDAVEQQIVSAGGQVPAAEIGYQLPGTISSTATARRVWGQLEDRVLAGWAGVCVASGGADRSAALDQMTAQAARVTGDGLALDWWPGWT